MPGPRKTFGTAAQPGLLPADQNPDKHPSLCCSPGCQMPGTQSESVRHNSAAEARWQCVFHARADHARHGMITLALKRHAGLAKLWVSARKCPLPDWPQYRAQFGHRAIQINRADLVPADAEPLWHWRDRVTSALKLVCGRTQDETQHDENDDQLPQYRPAPRTADASSLAGSMFGSAP